MKNVSIKSLMTLTVITSLGLSETAPIPNFDIMLETTYPNSPKSKVAIELIKKQHKIHEFIKKGHFSSKEQCLLYYAKQVGILPIDEKMKDCINTSTAIDSACEHLGIYQCMKNKHTRPHLIKAIEKDIGNYPNTFQAGCPLLYTMVNACLFVKN